MRRRHISGADDYDYQLNRDWWNAEVHRHGVEAGRRDALAKQPSDWVRAYKAFAASDEFLHGALHPDEGVPVTSDLDDWLPLWFQKGYEQGYAEGADAMEAAKPGAKGELGLINLAESLKIDRDTNPAAFAKWEQEQAAKMTGFDAASIDAALTLGLAAVTGIGHKAGAPKKSMLALWHDITTSGSSVGASDTSPALAGVEGMLLGAVLGGAGVGYLALKYARKEHAYGLQEAATGILENVPTGNVTYRDIVGAMNNTAKHYQWQAAQALK